MLATIAQDEFEEGNYGSPTFPAGAKLVYLTDPFSFEDSFYAVEDKNGNVLVDISDLMTFEPENGLTLISYVLNISEDIYKSFEWNYIGIVAFDDTGAGGTTVFAISYQVNGTMKDTLSKGVVTESASSKLGAATGTATLDGTAAVLTAPAQSISGKVSFAQ